MASDRMDRELGRVQSSLRKIRKTFLNVFRSPMIPLQERPTTKKVLPVDEVADSFGNIPRLQTCSSDPDKPSIPAVIIGKCEDCNKISELKKEKCDFENKDIFVFKQSSSVFYPRDIDQSIDGSTAIQTSRNRSRSPGSMVVRCKSHYDNYSNTYKNNSMPRGLVFMLNFEEFDEDIHTREGSQIDYANLLDLFKKMGYKCEEEKGFCKSGRITREECFQKLAEFREMEVLEKLDSCIIVIMSHGTGEKALLTTDGGQIKVKDIYKHFNSSNCPNLTGKPKIFIFQFCRLSESDTEDCSRADAFQKRATSQISKRRHDFLSAPGNFGSNSSLNKRNSRILSFISTNSSVFTDSGWEDELGNNCREFGNFRAATASPCPVEKSPRSSTSSAIPYQCGLSTDSSRVNLAQNQISRQNSDLFSIFSTIGGEVAYRHPKNGSPLIQAICQVFSEHACNENIEELFKKVSRRINGILQHDNEDSPLAASQQQTCERTNIGFDQTFYFNPQPLTEPIEETNPMFY